MTSKAKPIELRRLRAAIPEQVFELPRVRTFAKALFVLALLASALAIGTSMDSVPARLALGIAIGPILFMLASTGHESGHHTASRWRFLNDLVGTITMSVIGMPARGWKLKHDLHHKYGGVQALDTDSEPGLEDYMKLGNFKRWANRTFNTWEFLFWWLIPLSLWVTTWKWAFKELASPRSRKLSHAAWVVSDLVIATGFFAMVGLYTAAFGWTNLLLLIAVPFIVSGWVAAVTFVPNHRGMPPLTQEQSRRAARYTHLNSRTVLYPKFLPGNFFMNYVPWQIEHHIFPTVAGYRLKEISPHLREYARNEGIPLSYETVFEVMPRMIHREYLWGHGDGRLYSYDEAETIRRERIAAGLAPARTRERAQARAMQHGTTAAGR